MPHQPPGSALGDFLKALKEAEIPFILIGMMAAVEQGVPLATVDYDFWVKLPERQYIRILTIVHRLGGTILARTLYELSDGTQVNVIFKPDGLESFDIELKRCHISSLEGREVRVLPLDRVIASKKASGREKDRIALPILRKTLRMARTLKRKQKTTKKR